MFKEKIQNFKVKELAYLALISTPLIASVTIFNFQAIAQTSRKAVVFAPPSNVRASPNGQIICSVRSTTSINIYSYTNGWYETDYCGWGYIHHSQIRLSQNGRARRGTVFCDVIGIQRGQLALRYTPNGNSRAGLDNGNTVRLLQQKGIWAYVGVVHGSDTRVNGLEGWVNSNYLSCYE